MNKIDYNKLMEEIISNLTNKPKLLLHVCCAPCSSSVLNRLVNYFNITVYFFNPNMDTLTEYEKRMKEEINLINTLNKNLTDKINIVCCDYNSKLFYKTIKGFENCLEGGERCKKCFELRLENTCLYAKENNYDYFTTTLSVSPYKNSEVLNEIGKNLEEKHKIKYLYSDFKKKDGYKKSIELSKIYNLYRQNYCGCIFSKMGLDKK
ncbi:MAG: epoxyqueuosine reductase QueH [Clostridiales bacterium]|nr:epoxyqueuosine reductase QueH [Clostridiales bacterium]